MESDKRKVLKLQDSIESNTNSLVDPKDLLEVLYKKIVKAKELSSKLFKRDTRKLPSSIAFFMATGSSSSMASKFILKLTTDPPRITDVEQTLTENGNSVYRAGATSSEPTPFSVEGIIKYLGTR